MAEKYQKAFRVFHVSFLESVTDRFPKLSKLLLSVVKQLRVFYGNLLGLILINSHTEEYGVQKALQIKKQIKKQKYS